MIADYLKLSECLAGAGGFEPPYGGIKICHRGAVLAKLKSITTDKLSAKIYPVHTGDRAAALQNEKLGRVLLSRYAGVNPKSRRREATTACPLGHKQTLNGNSLVRLFGGGSHVL
jgi:hypothetical protein